MIDIRQPKRIYTSYCAHEIIAAIGNHGEKYATDIADEINRNRSVVSEYLQHLKDVNCVTVKKEGRKRLYKLTERGKRLHKAVRIITDLREQEAS